MTLKPKNFSTWFVHNPIGVDSPAQKSDKKNDPAKTAAFLFSQGKMLRGQGDYALAVKVLNQARAAFESLEDDYSLACTLEHLAFCSGELSRNSNALEYAHQSVAKFQQLGRTVELGWAYENLAYIYFYRYSYRESLSYTKKARVLFEECESKDGLAWNACNMARLYLDMTQPREARNFYLEALRAFTALKNEQGIAVSTLGLGTVHRTLCEFKTAEDYVKKAKKIYEGLKIKDHIGWCLLNEAAICRAQGNESAAADANRKANQNFTAVQKVDGIAWSFFQLGQVLRDQGLVAKSWQSLREGLNLHKEINNRKGIGWGENELGVTYHELNDLDRARECFMNAKSEAEKISVDPLRIDSCKNLANVYLDQGHLQEAAKNIEEAYSWAKKLETWEVMPEILIVRIRYALLTNDLNNALAHFDAAQALVKQYGLLRLDPELQVVRGELMARQHQLKEAAKVWSLAMQSAAKLNQRGTFAEAALGLAQVSGKTMTPAAREALLVKAEREARYLSSRRIKAKALEVRIWLAFRNKNFLDTKNVNQVTQIYGSSGYLTMERLFLDRVVRMAAGDEKEKAATEDSLQHLYRRAPAELNSVHVSPELFDYFPVSVVI